MLRMAARAAHLPRNLHRGREKMNVLCRIGMVPGPASREAHLSQVMVVYQEKRGYLGFVRAALSSRLVMIRASTHEYEYEYG